MQKKLVLMFCVVITILGGVLLIGSSSAQQSCSGRVSETEKLKGLWVNNRKLSHPTPIARSAWLRRYNMGFCLGIGIGLESNQTHSIAGAAKSMPCQQFVG